ncbi:AAA family ATPase, partial [Candidatus Babeliales bacterium]|nr:AAA family ATPase [Candidatus Babeliales bacterium]
MFFKRELEQSLKRFSKLPVVGIFGPRQSGKTTLAKQFFKNHTYVNLENPQIREFALEDPKGFLTQYENKAGIVIDEFQYAPQILSYIQLESDEKDRPGYFVLTGSQNFLMNEVITQSLAGRIGILTLLPFSINELETSNLLNENVNEVIFKGGYPR